MPKAHVEAFRRHPELYEIIGYAEADEAWIRRRGSLPCYAGVPRLSVEELLEKNGIKVIPVEFDEVMKGFGAIHCCTAFLKRG